MLTKALAYVTAGMTGSGPFLEATAALPDNEFAGLSRRKLWWILTPVEHWRAGRGFLFLRTTLHACLSKGNMLAKVSLTCLLEL